MDADRYVRLKNAVDSLRSKKDRADGALAQEFARLEKDHGCKTVASVRRKLAKAVGSLESAEADYERALDEFEAEWKDTLSRH